MVIRGKYMYDKSLKVIQTKYRGYKFRSRLEARWAVFFDNIGIDYEYEKEGYDLDGDWYLPDFWIPSWNCWVEIKPEVSYLFNDWVIQGEYFEKRQHKMLPTFLPRVPIEKREYELCYKLAKYSHKVVLLIGGSPWLTNKKIRPHLKDRRLRTQLKKPFYNVTAFTDYPIITNKLNKNTNIIYSGIDIRPPDVMTSMIHESHWRDTTHDKLLSLYLTLKVENSVRPHYIEGSFPEPYDVSKLKKCFLNRHGNKDSLPIIEAMTIYKERYSNLEQPYGLTMGELLFKIDTDGGYSLDTVFSKGVSNFFHPLLIKAYITARQKRFNGT